MVCTADKIQYSLRPSRILDDKEVFGLDHKVYRPLCRVLQYVQLLTLSDVSACVIYDILLPYLCVCAVFAFINI